MRLNMACPLSHLIDEANVFDLQMLQKSTLCETEITLRANRCHAGVGAGH